MIIFFRVLLLAFYEDFFDIPYQFGKYDQVFVPEFNMGAMENPGAVTFGEEFVHRYDGVGLP